MPRRPPRSLCFASLGNLFREARRARPQRQNNGARASDGAGLPWLSRKLRPEDCFGKPDGPAPSAEITERAPCDGAGLPWLSASKIPPLCIARKLVSGSPSGQPPAPKRRKRARGRLSQKLWPSPGKLFREARRASPQRQNNGARACDGAGLPWLSRKLRPSLSGSATGQLPAPKLRDPSVKTTGTSFRAARRARPKPKPSTILRIAKNGTRRARAGFLRTLNPKRF